MVRMFQVRLETQQALVTDMRTLSLARLSNGILAWDSFFHLNQDDQETNVSGIPCSRLPGAALMLTSGPSAGEAFGVLEGQPLYHASPYAAESC